MNAQEKVERGRVCYLMGLREAKSYRATEEGEFRWEGVWSVGGAPRDGTVDATARLFASSARKSPRGASPSPNFFFAFTSMKNVILALLYNSNLGILRLEWKCIHPFNPTFEVSNCIFFLCVYLYVLGLFRL